MAEDEAFFDKRKEIDFRRINQKADSGVVIGEGDIIGNNSLVLKDTEPWTINVGSPCKVI